jgi:hypothetical protein
MLNITGSFIDNPVVSATVIMFVPVVVALTVVVRGVAVELIVIVSLSTTVVT